MIWAFIQIKVLEIQKEKYVWATNNWHKSDPSHAFDVRNQNCK